MEIKANKIEACSAQDFHIEGLCDVLKHVFDTSRSASAIVSRATGAFLPNQALIDVLSASNVFISEFQNAVQETAETIDKSHPRHACRDQEIWFGPVGEDESDIAEVGNVCIRRIVSRGDVAEFLFVDLPDAGQNGKSGRSDIPNTYDPLTGLPNRATGLDRLGQALELSRRAQKENPEHVKLAAVAIIDIHDFTGLNDEIGTELADAALVELGRLIENTVRTYDTVARCQGDQFMVVLPSIRANEDMAVVCEKLLTAINNGIDVHGERIAMEVRIGIAMHPADGDTAETLFRRAEIALMDAKTETSNAYRFCNAEIAEQAQRRALIERSLRTAIDNEEFSLRYQPICCSHSEKVLGVETLIRWNNIELGDVSPAEFIPIAEDTGMIADLGRFVLFESARQAATWMRTGETPYISVNVSGKQLEDEDFAAYVKDVLTFTKLPAAKLQLELTETAILNRDEHVEGQLKAFGDMGVGLAIDDFGTGYSSLSRLQGIKFNCLKVDQSFVRDLENSQENTQMLCAINALAKSLGLKTVCEGVENEHQKSVIQDQEYDLMQGYHLGKPMTAGTIEELLAA